MNTNLLKTILYILLILLCFIIINKCSLVDRFTISSTNCNIGEWVPISNGCVCPQGSELNIHGDEQQKRCLAASNTSAPICTNVAPPPEVGSGWINKDSCTCPPLVRTDPHGDGLRKRCRTWNNNTYPSPSTGGGPSTNSENVQTPTLWSELEGGSDKICSNYDLINNPGATYGSRYVDRENINPDDCAQAARDYSGGKAKYFSISKWGGPDKPVVCLYNKGDGTPTNEGGTGGCYPGAGGMEIRRGWDAKMYKINDDPLPSPPTSPGNGSSTSYNTDIIPGSVLVYCDSTIKDVNGNPRASCPNKELCDNRQLSCKYDGQLCLCNQGIYGGGTIDDDCIPQ